MKNGVLLSRDNLYTNFWKLSWPVMLAMLLHSSLAVVDAFFVGRLGGEAVAALSLSGNIFWLIFSLSEVINVGTVAMVARYFGAEDRQTVGEIMAHSLWFTVVFALLVAGGLFAGSRSFLEFFDVGPEVISYGTEYLQIMSIGLIFLFVFVVFSASFQGAGDTRTPMKILLVVNGINIILNPLLIFGIGFFPRLEVAGAGVATAFSNLVGLVFVLVKVVKSQLLPLPPVLGFKLNPEVIKNLVKIGVPAGVQSVSRPLTGMILMWMVALFGNDAVAAFGVGQRTLSYSFILLAGLMVASTTMVGQSLGAKDKELAWEISQKALLMGVTVQGAVALVYFVLAAPIMKVFLPNEPLAVEMGTSYLRITSLGLFVGGWARVLVGVFKGAGDTVPSMVAAFSANWLVKLPVAYLMAIYFDLGTDGVWWAIAISVVFELMMLIYWYFKKKWLEREIVLKSRESIPREMSKKGEFSED